MVRDELLAALPHLRRLPDRIDRILTLTSRGDLRLRHVVDEDGRRMLRTFVNRGLLAAVGAAFLFAATLLLGRRRRADRRRAPRACSSSSATAACSPARCSSCGSSAAVARDGTT